MNFIDRRNKIAVQQERANLYNDIQDQLIDQDVGEDEHASVIQGKLTQHTRTQLEELQIKRESINPNLKMTSKLPRAPVSVLTTSAMISLGLDQYPQMTSQAQDFNINMEKGFLRYKDQKKNGIPEEQLRQQLRERADDEARQQILFKCDHLKELENASHRGFK